MDSQSRSKPVPPKSGRSYGVPYHVFASNSAPEVSQRDNKAKEIKHRPRARKPNYKLPENYEDGWTDQQTGQIIHLTGDKKRNVEVAIYKVCRELQSCVPADYIQADWKAKFDTLLTQHVRGIMYTLMAPQPLLTPAKYIQLYQITNSPSKNVDFMKSMRDRLVNLIKNTPKIITPPTPEEEAEWDKEESIEDVKQDPKFLDWIQKAANGNCWYMDYIFGKVLTKAVKTVRSENMIEDVTGKTETEVQPMEISPETEDLIKTDEKDNENNVTDIVAESSEETPTKNNVPVAGNSEKMDTENNVTADVAKDSEETATEMNVSTDIVAKNNMDNITFRQLLEKINKGSSDDMDEVVRFVDLRLARMASRIKSELILAATRAPGLVVLHPRMKQLGLDGLELKTWRKLHYATVVTHRSVSAELLKRYSIAASWQSRPFKKIPYAQTNVAVLARSPFKHLLSRHMKYFEGFKMAAVRSFPPDEEDLEDEREFKLKKEEKKAKRSLSDETDDDNEELPPELY